MKDLKKYILENKVKYVDKAGTVGLALTVGIPLDLATGLVWPGIMVSRTYSSAVSYVVGDHYMKYREYLFRKTKTTEESNWFREKAVDLFAFNTFHTPLYMVGLTIAEVGQKLYENLFADGDYNIDLMKVVKGGIILATISPFASLLNNSWMDGFRKIFKVKPAVERAYEEEK